MKNFISILLFLIMGLTIQAQDFELLTDISGRQPSAQDIIDINAAADKIHEFLPPNTEFKIFDSGFYIYNELMTGDRLPAIWEDIKEQAGDKSRYYILFGRQYSPDGTFQKWWVDIELPDSENCIDEELEYKLTKNIETAAKRHIENGVFEAEKLAVDFAGNLMYKVVMCECNGLRYGCGLSPDFSIVDNNLITQGFRVKEIELGSDNTWNNGDQHIYDYVQKDLIIDGVSYNIPDEVKGSKLDFDNGVTITNEDTTMSSTPMNGHVYILDINSFDLQGNDTLTQWEHVKNISETLDYLECWVVLVDDDGQAHLYSKFTLANSSIAEIPEDQPLAIREEGASENRSGVPLSPMGAALKLLGNAAVDACMQALIIRLVDDKVKDKPTEGERWIAAFGEVSYFGAAWEGISSLLPWKKDLISTIVRTATSALVVVVDKARQPDYTIKQGFIDFGIGFGASGLTQLITPKLGQYGGRIISNGLDTWYEKTSSTILRRIIFYCSKNFDDYVNRVVKSQKYIDQSDVVSGIKKIDLMGGNKTQLSDDFINIDIRSTIEKGIKGDATKLGNYIPNNSVDEIVTNNPYLKGALSANDYVKEAAKVLKSGKLFYINGQMSNKYFNKVNHELADKHGFIIEQLKVPLLNQFKNIKFFKSNGITPIEGDVFSTVLRKI